MFVAACIFEPVQLIAAYQEYRKKVDGGFGCQLFEQLHSSIDLKKIDNFYQILTCPKTEVLAKLETKGDLFSRDLRILASKFHSNKLLAIN